MRAEPASLAHVLAMTQGDRAVRVSLLRSDYRLIAAQMVVSDAWALFGGADHIPFAIVGGANLPAGGIEAWFIARPQMRRSDLLACVRFARQHLAACRQRIIAFVGIGNGEGERLAQLCGFHRGDAEVFGCQEWRRENVQGS